MAPKYNFPQTVFCLNWLANLVQSLKGSEETLTHMATEGITSVLDDSAAQDLLGTWELVWGPRVFTHAATKNSGNDIADNAMYVAKLTSPITNVHQTEYVIAVAGTNPASWYGWLIEDFWVGNSQAWPYLPEDYSGPLKPKVSEGTARGLNHLFEDLIPLEDSPGAGQKLLEFLTEELTQYDAGQRVRITVTGHSLGGALSASLALALKDMQRHGQGWDPGLKATIAAIPSAGATPGDADFAQYYDAVLGPETVRIWNKIDVIPHAWQADMLEQVPFMFYPYLSGNGLLKSVVDIALSNAKSSGVVYRQIMAQTPPMIGQVNLNLLDTIDPEDLLITEEGTVLTHLLEKALGKFRGGLLNRDLLLSNQSIAEAIVGLIKPWMNGKREEDLSEALGSLPGKVRDFLTEVWEDVEAVLLFFLQLGYQHVPAYHQLMNTTRFLKIHKQAYQRLQEQQDGES